MKPIALVLLLGAAPVPRPQDAGPCVLGEETYRGWKALRLSNGIVTLHVVPEIGGRIIQAELGGHPYFWINPATEGKVFPPEESGGSKDRAWKNYGGSKLWPAPQGWDREDLWPGPGDPVLDAGPYRAEILERGPDAVGLRLTSPEDPYSGIQFVRTIRLVPAASRVDFTLEMKNVSHRRVRWGIWEVVQHRVLEDGADPAAARSAVRVYCPVNPRSRFPGGYTSLYGLVNDPRYRVCPRTGILEGEYAWRVHKIGLDSDGGWLAVVDGASRHAFLQTFRPEPGREYPDGSSVEFWFNGPGPFVINGNVIEAPRDPAQSPAFLESEVLSPFAALAPGESFAFRTEWLLTRVGTPILAPGAAGVAHRTFRAVRAGPDRVRVEGSFGVFQEGEAELQLKDFLGFPLLREPLGRATPLEPAAVSREIRVPAGAVRAVVRVRGPDGRDLGPVVSVPVGE